MRALQILAGPEALTRIRAEGWQPDLFSHLGAAAGGAKWIMLAGLDKLLFGGWLARRSTPLIAVGASIGAWRLACAAQRDPLAALNRFTRAYVDEQFYQRGDGRIEVSREAQRILAALLGETGADEIPQHPWLRLNIVAARGLAGIDGSGSRREKLALARAVFANTRSRQALGRHLARTVIHAGDTPVALQDDGFATHVLRLTADNVAAALTATAAIPGIIDGIASFPGAPAGYHLDGGLIDYHMDLPLAEPAGLMLLPHFSDRITTGWLDQFLPWRRPRHLARTVVLAPTAELVASLPARRIPNRKDFMRYAGRDAERVAHWHAALAASEAMAGDYADWLAAGAPATRIAPLR